jgi:enoyl-CoA hydratase
LRTDFETILVDQVESTLVITLNRPEVRNALDYTMEVEFYEALALADRDDTIAAVVLKGAGKIFSAGHDMKAEAKEWELEYGRILDSRFYPYLKRFEGPVATWAIRNATRLRARLRPRADLPTIDGEPWFRTSKLPPSWRFGKPLIAAVHGYVGPHANAILMTCDFVLAAEGTRFSFEQTRAGVGPPWGPYVLIFLHFPMRVIGKLWMTGGWMDAEQAHDLHYVQRVVDASELEAEALKWAAQMALVDAGGFRAAKLHTRAVYEKTVLKAPLRAGRRVMYMNPVTVAKYFELMRNEGLRAAIQARDAEIDPTITRI